MAKRHSTDYFTVLGLRYRKAVKDKNFREALRIAAYGYVIATDLRDKDIQTAFLYLFTGPLFELVENPTSSLHQEQVGTKCSFCGRSKTEAKLILGSTGSICRKCVSKLYKAAVRRDH